jgi:hypothetical protein
MAGCAHPNHARNKPLQDYEGGNKESPYIRNPRAAVQSDTVR